MRLIPLALVVNLALCSCGSNMSDRQRNEIADIAGDVAADPDEVAALRSRVDELESEVRRLTENDKADTANIDILFTKVEWSERAIDTLYENDQTLAARTGLPVERPQ